jgi:hypothetical protein
MPSFQSTITSGSSPDFLEGTAPLDVPGLAAGVRF